MKEWIGKSLLGIGMLHTLVGVVLLLPLVGGELLSDGVFNTINGQPKREAFLWFLFAGFLLMTLGGLINFMEKTGQPLPDFLGWTLLSITVFALILSPLSGVWLILIPAVALRLKNKK